MTAHAPLLKVRLCARLPSVFVQVSHKRIQCASKARRRSYRGATKLDPSVDNYPSGPWMITNVSELGVIKQMRHVPKLV